MRCFLTNDNTNYKHSWRFCGGVPKRIYQRKKNKAFFGHPRSPHCWVLKVIIYTKQSPPPSLPDKSSSKYIKKNFCCPFNWTARSIRNATHLRSYPKHSALYAYRPAHSAKIRYQSRKKYSPPKVVVFQHHFSSVACLHASALHVYIQLYFICDNECDQSDEERLGFIL